MTHLSEAACLLKSGALYRSRVLFELDSGDPIFVGFKTGAFSIYFGDEPIFHFDLEGRWQRAFLKGTHYLKSLDTTVQAIDRVREGENMVLRRRTLLSNEANDLDTSIKNIALGLKTMLVAEALKRLEPPTGVLSPTVSELFGILDAVAKWNGAAWVSQREIHRATYAPFGFIPPDALSRVVLQCTTGTRDGLAFGGAVGAPGVVRNPEQFQAHARDASRLLGRRAEQFKGLFLTGSDLILEAANHLHDYLRIATEHFPFGDEKGSHSVDPKKTARGVQVFIDRFPPDFPTVEQWQQWRRLGLTEVTLGIESGDPDIRGLFGKKIENDDLVRLVEMLGAAELKVGLVVLLGAGGEARRESHIQETVSLIAKMPLQTGAIVSFVDQRSLVAGDPTPKAEDHPGVDDSAIPSQFQAIKAGLQAWRSTRGTKVVYHNLDKQEV